MFGFAQVTVPVVLAVTNKVVSASRLFSPKEKTSSQDQLPPTVRYFVEKAKGNTQLDTLKTEALRHVEKNNSNTPPDQYFSQLKSDNARVTSGRYGMIPPHMTSGLLADYEKKAEKYVQQFISPVSSIESKS